MVIEPKCLSDICAEHPAMRAAIETAARQCTIAGWDGKGNALYSPRLLYIAARAIERSAAMQKAYGAPNGMEFRGRI
jgi:hypothetical protein